MAHVTLTPEDLHALTGYRQPRKQVEWLRSELGLEPPIGADGRPRVSQAVVDQATLARRTAAIPANSPSNIFSPGPQWTVAA